MVEASGFDSDQCLACAQRRQFLHTDVNHLRTAGAERPGNPAFSRLIHDESPYHRAPDGSAGRPDGWSLSFSKSILRFVTYADNVPAEGDRPVDVGLLTRSTDWVSLSTPV